MLVLTLVGVVFFLGIISLGIIFLGIPLAVTLATPVRYLKFYLLWIAMLAVLAVAWPAGADDSSSLSHLCEALEAVFLGTCAFFVAARISIVEAIYPEAAYGVNFPSDLPDEFAADEFAADEFALGMAALTGLFAAPWSMFLVALAFAGPSATLAHDSTFIVPIAAAALLAKARNAASEMVQTFATALFASAIITLAMAAIRINPHVGF
jgi:hypothetical protein